tara:strand:- start:336 stop:1910 length:1575 start_codon:yes stop_codon:yes gene_type:complete
MTIHGEIELCRNNFDYFCENYLKIVTKDATLERLRLNKAQRSIDQGFNRNRHQMILKARQLGSTTGIAARFFWDALFNPHMSVAVVAHTDEAVKRIFDIYRRFYENLPPFLKLETTRSRENEIRFVTGSNIKVGSASTQSFRGGTYQRIHASEYAFWTNIETAIASLFQTATSDAIIALESTANGMNEGYDLWTKDNGFLKTFLNWQQDEDYRLERPQFDNQSEEEVDYAHDNELNAGQYNWMVQTLRTKCGNNWNIFNQEYPAKAEDAFVTSGTRFFPMTWEVTDFTEGYQEFEAPRKFQTYVMGVDTASGSPGGDYSAIMLLRVTPGHRSRMVASFYDRLPPSIFRNEVERICKRYDALVVVESNSYGLSIVEHLQAIGYPYLYRSTIYDKVSSKIQSKLGFYTSSKTRPLLISRLYDHVVNQGLVVDCPRFKYEANRMEYNSRGKVEAASGQHDDLCMATGLALMGLDQVDQVTEDATKGDKPVSIKEVLDWELATGKLWSKHNPDEFNEQVIPTSVGDFL